MMQVSTTRFVKIEGTEVRVAVNSAAEARVALKELKHKKKELSYIRKSLLKQQRASGKRQMRAARPQSLIWRIFDRRKRLVQAIAAVVDVFRPRRPAMDGRQIQNELRRIEEVQHGIESCALQLEGKLISDG